MFIFNECQGDSTNLEILRYDGAQYLQPIFFFFFKLNFIKEHLARRF